MLATERGRRPFKASELPDFVLSIVRSRSVAQGFATIAVELGPAWLSLDVRLAALARITRSPW